MKQSLVSQIVKTISVVVLVALSSLSFAGAIAADGEAGKSDGVNAHPAFEPVKGLFLAISNFDEKAMKAVATQDFQLLEHGEVWTMDKLSAAIMPKNGPYQRTNYFDLIRVQELADAVWISYWNKAHFESERGAGDVVWLESAIMVKSEGVWKIQMLHSTRLRHEHVPDDINWIEVK